MNVFHILSVYFSYTFVRYAFAVGLLTALCAALLGAPLVLKRFSFLGDGLSHVAFGAMAVATALGLSDNTLLVLPVTMLSAVLLLRTGRRARVQGDAAVAMISVGSLAAGYLLLSLRSESSNLSGDVCSTLFGSASILTLTAGDVALCAACTAATLGFFVLCYHKLFAVTFDEDFARASGVPAGTVNLLLALVIAAVIVLGMRLVGSLLIAALMIFPALSAMQLFRSFRAVTVCSACLGVVCAAAGLIAALLAGTPVGPTVAVADMAAFGVCWVIGRRG